MILYSINQSSMYIVKNTVYAYIKERCKCVYMCLFSLKKNIVGAEMPALPRVLKSKAGKEGGKGIPALGTPGLVSCLHLWAWRATLEKSTFQLFALAL